MKKARNKILPTICMTFLKQQKYRSVVAMSWGWRKVTDYPGAWGKFLG